MNAWIFGIILVQLIIVSWIDIKIRKISNLWFALNLLLSILLHFIFPEAYPWEWAILLFPLGWIVIGFVLFSLKIMGAGDSKYLSSLFLIIPPDYHMVMFEKVVYSTTVVGLVMLTIKIARDFQKIKAYAFSTYWIGLKEAIRSRFSFAPVILLAWLLLGAQKWF